MNNKSSSRTGQAVEEDQHVEQSSGANQHSHYTSDRQDPGSDKGAGGQPAENSSPATRPASDTSDALKDSRAQQPVDFTGIELERVGTVAGGQPAENSSPATRPASDTSD